MLHAAPSVSIPDPRRLEVADYHDVMPVVRQTEQLERLLPRAIMMVFIGLPILLGLLRGHPILGLVNALLLTFVGAFLCRVIAVSLLAPLHAVRYGRLMRSLAATLDALAPAAILKLHWMAGAPGALAITPLSTVLLVDRSTDYRFVSLADEEIVAVDRHVDEAVQMTSRSRPGVIFGFPLARALFGGFSLGGRTVTKAHVTRSHSVLLRYQREDDPAIRCAVIPFGLDELGAENLRIMLDGLRSATAA